jgi:hypothetical protein
MSDAAIASFGGAPVCPLRRAGLIISRQDLVAHLIHETHLALLLGLAFMAGLAKGMRLRAARSQVNAVQQTSRAISPGCKSLYCGITLLPVARLY